MWHFWQFCFCLFFGFVIKYALISFLKNLKILDSQNIAFTEVVRPLNWLLKQLWQQRLIHLGYRLCSPGWGWGLPVNSHFQISSDGCTGLHWAVPPPWPVYLCQLLEEHAHSTILQEAGTKSSIFVSSNHRNWGILDVFFISLAWGDV